VKQDIEDLRGRFAWWLMKLCYRIVERIDRRAVPKYASVFGSFTFERGVGIVLHTDEMLKGKVQIWPDGSQLGCKVFYLNDWDYERAHTEAVNG